MLFFNKEERIKFGKVSVDRIIDLCKKGNLRFIDNTSQDDRFYESVHGDIKIKLSSGTEIECEVKRGTSKGIFLSEKCISNFKGNYFIFDLTDYNRGIKYIERQSILNFVKKVDKFFKSGKVYWDNATSGDFGIYFSLEKLDELYLLKPINYLLS